MKQRFVYLFICVQEQLQILFCFIRCVRAADNEVWLLFHKILFLLILFIYLGKSYNPVLTDLSGPDNE